MRSTFRPNVKLILAAICVIAGIVILWRSFARTPDPVAGVVPPTQAELELSATPLQQDPTVLDDSPTNIPATQLLPTTNTQATQLLPTTNIPATQLLPSPIIPSAVAPNPGGSTAAPTMPAPGVIATQGTAPTIAAPTVASNRVTITPLVTTQVGVTQIGATAVPTTIPTSVPGVATSAATTISTLVPTSAPGVATFTAIVATQTPLPTAVPASTSTPANTPTSVPTSTPLIATATPTTNMVTVVYRVEGAASKVIVSYLDADGKEVRIPDATLPWRVQFSATSDADLAVDAFGTNNEVVTLSCAIDVNGTTILTDQTQDATQGVACERFLN